MIGKLLLNRYELLEKIGEGGMGVVYKAKCHLLNRFVAVKILKAELSDDEDFVMRFKREATSIAKLSHPNIVNIHDVGSENNINFIIMEYINGKTLKQIIKEDGRLSPQKTLDIVLQVAKALECAHSNNIIHRDIKPDNIMITQDMMVKIMDFGIAKVMDSSTITISNKVMGTVHYFSPEQAKGKLVDCRTDIYSLGIVMYEMVTGKVPYNAESSITIAMMHIQETAIPPKKIITDIPENINQVILKAMEKEPIKRYQTANEMVKILMSIKENPNYKIGVNNNIDNATRLMDTVISSDIRDDLTTIMSPTSGEDETMINNDIEVQPLKRKISKKKKVMILMASIILVMFVAGLGKFISKDETAKTPTSAVKTTVPVVENTSTKATEDVQVTEEVPTTEELPVNEMKVIPSLIGSTQEIAEQNVVNNGFSLGNVSNNYSDSVDKGLVISQSPEVNTSYEKGGKIDIVISQGEKEDDDEKELPQVKERDKKKGKTIDQKKLKNDRSKD
ncbi:Stk1 family PASTA domain-containing Ser/Thr kinase [Clostridium lacusfryxellense]|uniref:Stk1 family PASTA domain-containing Ser/Thr kinase n=1 Tax=Clostridium lacusfryxellense TaxID=205328 RepID=UPI001C0B765F|nr:Stk1 family PASTA domain-containing Ser/Thr kinase [Clostridium lacusfryxellense]MBU3114078.1 Stk1 family PASTA domain-containing Ser/Thr kinase [Clostridium lacusfryxellense]